MTAVWLPYGSLLIYLDHRTITSVVRQWDGGYQTLPKGKPVGYFSHKFGNTAKNMSNHQFPPEYYIKVSSAALVPSDLKIWVWDV